jgi:hypothetical protein
MHYFVTALTQSTKVITMYDGPLAIEIEGRLTFNKGIF